MKAAYLIDNNTVDLKDVVIPTPGYGEVLIRMMASTICESDLNGLPLNQHDKQHDKVCGHESSGLIVKAGKGLRRFKEGDRVIVYHISGCGVCSDCRQGYMINCTSDYRRAYGCQRDGGMAEYLIAEEKDLVLLPDALTFIDGAQIAFSFGSVYEGLNKIGISNTESVLVVGLGPIGLAACMLAKAMGSTNIIGVDTDPKNLSFAIDKNLITHGFIQDDTSIANIQEVTSGFGVEKAIECSGDNLSRQLAIQGTRKWGKIVLISHDGNEELMPSHGLKHNHKTIYGSSGTNIWRMEELVDRIVQWGIHPEDILPKRMALKEVSEAYKLLEEGLWDKVAIVCNEV